MVYDESQSKKRYPRWSTSGRGPECTSGAMGDGSHPDDAVYVMLKEVIDNSVA